MVELKQRLNAAWKRNLERYRYDWLHAKKTTKILAVLILFIIIYDIVTAFSGWMYCFICRDKIAERYKTLAQVYQEEIIFPPSAKIKKEVLVQDGTIRMKLKRTYTTTDNPLDLYSYFQTLETQNHWKRLGLDRGKYHYNGKYRIQDKYIAEIHVDIEKNGKKTVTSEVAFWDFWEMMEL